MRPVAICLLMFILAASAFADTTLQKKEQNPIFVVKTSMGDIQVELFADETPETVRNFIGLAEGTKEFIDPAIDKKVKRPFYDGLTFHRVIKNFMIQGGCPKGDGTGSPGYRFDDEINTSHAPLRGVFAMANSGPNTNGSQFFINLVDTPWLSGKHTVFGKVVAGMDVVDNIGNVKTGAGDRPVKPIKILSIKQLAP